VTARTRIRLRDDQKAAVIVGHMFRWPFGLWDGPSTVAGPVPVRVGSDLRLFQGDPAQRRQRPSRVTAFLGWFNVAIVALVGVSYSPCALAFGVC